MFHSICVVCVGNICRSPLGERLLQQMLPNKKIASAGISAMVGESAYSKSIVIANNHNLSLDGHIARQLTKSICTEYDLLLVMEKYHIEAICNIAPEVRGKVMLYGHWFKEMEIADPYGHEIEFFEKTYVLLDKSAQAWANKLK